METSIDRTSEAGLERTIARKVKAVNLPYVYEELDKGRTVESLAKELKVSSRTLYRAHQIYQDHVPVEQKRISLTNGRGRKKVIDMDKVFEKIEAGESVVSVARECGVSAKTLYRHASN